MQCFFWYYWVYRFIAKIKEINNEQGAQIEAQREYNSAKE